MRHSILLTALVATLLATGCVKNLQEPMDEKTKVDFEECRRITNDFIDGPHSSDNPYWANYFEMCMSTRGHSQQELRKYWY